MITRDLADILHALRKIRNKAAHENYSSIEDGKTLLQMAYSLSEWFMQTYGDWTVESVGHSAIAIFRPFAGRVPLE